ncbi:SPFH domain-containing protein [Parabacteroides sp.]
MPIIKSIYWEQNNQDELVYKFPFNNVTTGSVLTVNDSQEAFFFKSGTLCDSFTSGRHVLSSANLPILQKIINLPSGGDTTFTAEVWFVSKLEKRNMLWGTGGLRIIDPYFQIPIKLSSRGQYGFRISDGGVFLKKLIGTIGFANTDLLEDQFRSDVIEAVKITIARFMKENNVNINELGTEYRALAKAIARNLQLSFDEYGIELLNFNIEDINFDENDKGYQTVMEGIAEQAKLSKLGVNYLQQKQIDIAQIAAGNEGAGNFMGVGMGLGMGNMMGGLVGNAIQQSGLATPPPPLPISSYYVAKEGKTTGPFSLDVLQSMMMRQELTPQTYVYKVGGNTWALLEDELELMRLLSSIVPPPPPTV